MIQNREKTNKIVITWFKLQGMKYMILEALKERERERMRLMFLFLQINIY